MDIRRSYPSSKDTTTKATKRNEEQTEQNDTHKFVLPPEYDETDSRWTLKYREPAPGLVELMEYSGVYVNADKLAECETLSNDCASLARRLLNEIFTDNALSVCSVSGAKPSHLEYGSTDLRPQLDIHAMVILLKFVAEYGLEKDWEITNYPFIQNCIQRKLEVTRFVRMNCVEDGNDYETVKRKRLYDNKSTLKHRFPSAGLVELIEHSGVYVCADKLAECKELSFDCVTLAQRLLREVFNRRDLRDCSLSFKTSSIFGMLQADAGDPYALKTRIIGANELDAHAEIILLHFVDEYGLKMGWSILDFQFIREIITHELKQEAAVNKEFMNNKRQRLIQNKFVLPPEYDETDSRWTLKYREPAPGLVELIEHSSVYVNADKLAECKTLSNNCVSLARRLLNEIFTDNALSVCSVSGAKLNYLEYGSTYLRPQLEIHAMVTLLKFVAEYGLEKDWEITNYTFIQNCIQRKLVVTRYVRSNCVEDGNENETVKRRLYDNKSTLKHRFPSAGLVELIEHSGVYVCADKLAECKELSFNCVTLAQRLLREVFSKEALRVCSLSHETSRIFGMSPASRVLRSRILYAHAEIILLHFVDEYGLKMGWPIMDFQFIRQIIEHELKQEAADNGDF